MLCRLAFLLALKDVLNEFAILHRVTVGILETCNAQIDFFANDEQHKVWTKM